MKITLKNDTEIEIDDAQIQAAAEMAYNEDMDQAIMPDGQILPIEHPNSDGALCYVNSVGQFWT